MRQAILFWLIVLPGVLGACVFGWFSLQDFTILKMYFAKYEQVIQHAPNATALLLAEANQNIYRINVFADGVWTLLCLIYAAIGAHGLCLLPTSNRRHSGARQSVAQ